MRNDNITKEILEFSKTIKENALENAKKQLLEDLSPFIEEEVTSQLFAESKDESDKDEPKDDDSEKGSDATSDKEDSESEGTDTEVPTESGDEGSEDGMGDLSGEETGIPNENPEGEDSDIDSLSPEDLADEDFDEDIKVYDDEDSEGSPEEGGEHDEKSSKQILNDIKKLISQVEMEDEHSEEDSENGDDDKITIDIPDYDLEENANCYPNMQESFIQKPNIFNRLKRNASNIQESKKPIFDKTKASLIKENNELKKAFQTLVDTQKSVKQDIDLAKHKTGILKKLFEHLNYTDVNTKKYIINEFDKVKTVKESENLFQEILKLDNVVKTENKKTSKKIIKENFVAKKVKKELKEQLENGKDTKQSDKRILQEQELSNYWDRIGGVGEIKKQILK